MSRIGRMPITVPAGVELSINGSEVSVKGPKGSLSLVIAEPIVATREEDGTIVVTRPNDERKSRALHGLTRTLISNMVIGVTEGYTKTLEISGTGYRVTQQGTGLEFALGYSHPIKIEAPAGITLTVETPTKFHVSGVSKQQVGEVSANLRKLRKPDPYKAKGVRYSGEVIRRKAGKAGKK